MGEQTYEGGLGGEPGNEAHGGYTFCGLAALLLAGQPAALDLPRLAHWAACRQARPFAFCMFVAGVVGRIKCLKRLRWA